MSPGIITQPLLIHISGTIKQCEQLPPETSSNQFVGGEFPNGTMWKYDTDRRVATVWQLLPTPLVLAISHLAR